MANSTKLEQPAPWASSKQPKPSSTINILISTDNHLGYNEHDPRRGDDSFRTFEEVLCLARSNNVDMLLLGGDLFHQNRPSRKTLYRTMRLLRIYCLSGTPQTKLRVVSDPRSTSTVPHRAEVALPVFIIHGNHDDPTGGIGDGALSALDLLEMAGLITYFGRSNFSKRINVAPLLLQKKNTGLALYGLGNIRDEVLHDTWSTQNAVSFEQPKLPNDISNDEIQPVPPSSWFSLFTLHQNRYSRGSSQGISETLLPEWLDYVVWGHEHESLASLPNTKPFIVQPGSTVATSLSKSEAGYKNAVLIEVDDGKLMSHRVVALHTVRGFEFGDVSLRLLEGVQEADHQIKISRVLEGVVNGMLSKQNALFEQKLSSFRNRSRNKVINGVVYPPYEFYTDKLEGVRQPLLRLRVEITGDWNTPSPQAFGRNYEDTVGWPWGILLYYRTRSLMPKKRMRREGEGIEPKDGNCSGGESADEVDRTRNEAEEHKVKNISSELKRFLSREDQRAQGLEFLEIDKLCEAVGEFVHGEDTAAIRTHVEKYMRKTQDDCAIELDANRRRVDESALAERFYRNAREAHLRFLKDEQDVFDGVVSNNLLHSSEGVRGRGRGRRSKRGRSSTRGSGEGGKRRGEREREKEISEE